MARALRTQNLKKYASVTKEGASAYTYKSSQPLIHLTFTLGSALFTDGFYHSQEAEVRRLAEALLGAHKIDPRFPWQYGAWMRDPKRGKGNRIQGSLVPALLDSILDEGEYNEDYVALCLSHRVDDVMAFVEHYRNLGLGEPSGAARRGMARALASFDEYQLLKYTGKKRQVRLCDAVYMVQEELQALGGQGDLALQVGKYLHAPTRLRREHLGGLPLAAARVELFQQPKSYAKDPRFKDHVAGARVSWEQVVGHFGTNIKNDTKEADKAASRNQAVWKALLETPGLMPDMALMRNLRNLHEAGFAQKDLMRAIGDRKFRGVWPHQVYAGYRAVPEMEPAFSKVLSNLVGCLPSGRHLGIGDASGSMSVKVGGLKGSTTAMDVAFCLVGLMSETSGVGASFSDSTWGGGEGIYMAKRTPGEGPLAFSQRPELFRGWGGTQVFGAIMDLIRWLKKNKDVAPPECLWFFSDMQFHPAGGASAKVPEELQAEAKALGLGSNVPPLELAVKLYRKVLGPVDVVLWNLAAYAPVPVPATMDNVLLVSGFDANTFKHVEAWREGKTPGGSTSVEVAQEVVLDTVRTF